MPTKRTPIGRRQRSRITDEVVDAFIAHERLESIYVDCLRNIACRSLQLNQHCRECAEYLEVGNKIEHLLQIPLWDRHSFDPDPEPPADKADRRDWNRAVRLRNELEAAAARRNGASK